MSSVTIKKVSSRKDLERFIDFHYDLYEGCEQDVPNLFSDEMNTLDKTKNAAFEFSEAEYFMAFYEDGRMAGRVAAIINHRANKRWGRKSSTTSRCRAHCSMPSRITASRREWTR